MAFTLQGHHRAARRGRADARNQLEHAQSGDVIAWVFRPSQNREDILDVCRFKKLEAAELDERDVPSNEFHLELARVVGRAKQNGLLPQLHSCFPVGENALDHAIDLLRLVRNHRQNRPPAV